MTQEYLQERLQYSLEELIRSGELDFNYIDVVFVDECFDNDGYDYCAQVLCDDELCHVLADKDFTIIEITKIEE